jgi:hypothetical protein
VKVTGEFAMTPERCPKPSEAAVPAVRVRTVFLASPDHFGRKSGVELRVPSRADRLKSKARSVGDFAFYGMWKDRTDIGDSVEYISKLRRNLRD